MLEDISGMRQMGVTQRKGLQKCQLPSGWLLSCFSLETDQLGEGLSQCKGWKEEKIWRTQLFKYKNLENPMGFVANNRSIIDHESQEVKDLLFLPGQAKKTWDLEWKVTILISLPIWEFFLDYCKAISYCYCVISENNRALVSLRSWFECWRYCSSSSEFWTSTNSESSWGSSVKRG